MSQKSRAITWPVMETHIELFAYLEVFWHLLD